MVKDSKISGQLQVGSSNQSVYHVERQASPTDAFLRSRILLSMVLDDPNRRYLIANLKDQDAQSVIDYLDKVRL